MAAHTTEGLMVTVHCSGCRDPMEVDALHPRFPAGPFACPGCARAKRAEGPPGRPEEEADVEIAELDAGGAVVDAKVRF